MIKNYLFLLIFSIINLSTWGQNVDSKLSQSTVTLGEEFKFTLEVECKESDNIQLSKEYKNLTALRASEGKTSPDSLKLELLSPFTSKKEKIQGKTYWVGEFSLICFDTGYLILPPVSVQFNGKSIDASPALLRVNLMAKNKNVDLYDIEENFTVLPEASTNWSRLFKTIALWTLLILSLIVLIYYVFFKKKKKLALESPAAVIGSYEKTRQELNALMEKKMWRKDMEKEHFTELSLIIRRFLNEEYNNRFEGKTSFEIQMILRKEHFSSKQLIDFGLILNVSDMVKFAKSSVEEEGIQTIYRKAIEFVNETEKK
jgi:hypothetical protein